MGGRGLRTAGWVVSALVLAAVFRTRARLLPLARLDMTPKLVQHFKGALDAIGLHGGPVRPPRQELDAAERETLRAAVEALGVPTAA